MFHLKGDGRGCTPPPSLYNALLSGQLKINFQEKHIEGDLLVISLIPLYTRLLEPCNSAVFGVITSGHKGMDTSLHLSSHLFP